LEQAEYTCPPIDKVWYGREDGDEGATVVGTGNNTLKLYSNPFLVEDNDHTAADIQTAITNIYDVVSAYSGYTPFKLTTFLYEWFEYKGTMININGEVVPVFHISWNQNGIMLETTGSPDRTYVQPASLAEQRMIGKYNVLKTDVDGTRREIGNAYDEISVVSQTVDGVKIELQSAIDDVEGELDEHARIQRTYIQYGADGLTLGKENSTTKTRLTNERLEFIDGTGDIKGYIGYDQADQTYKFYITNGHINNYLEYGDTFSAIASSDGHHLTFKGR